MNEIVTYSRKEQNTKKPLLIFLSVTAILLFICLIIFMFICSPMIIKGDSMSPTLADGQFVMISKVDTSPKFNDIVIYKRPNEDYLVIKRVVGVEGDKFSFVFESGEYGKLFKNGKEVDNTLSIEQYFALNKKYGGNSFVVGKNEIFTLGDNRKVSIDGRNYGCINIDCIVGIKI